jgi:hypothetical protein
VIDARQILAGAIVEALDGFGITNEWSIAQEIRSMESGSVGLTSLARRATKNQAFQNLVVGTIAEGLFRAVQLEPLEGYGFTVVDYHEAGENRDYGVQKFGLELPINVKTASTLFRNARQTVGLDPEDCIPISAYKALGAADRVPDLLYVDLVDFDLREKVDGFIETLTGPAEILWDLFSWHGGSGAKKAQDKYIWVLFKSHRAALEQLVADTSKFRAISAKKVIAIMREKPRRVPGLGIKAAGTGAFVAEVNVHVSVRNETQPWEDVAALVKSDGIQAALDRIRRTENKITWSPLL